YMRAARFPVGQNLFSKLAISLLNTVIADTVTELNTGTFAKKCLKPNPVVIGSMNFVTDHAYGQHQILQSPKFIQRFLEFGSEEPVLLFIRVADYQGFVELVIKLGVTFSQLLIFDNIY